MNEKNLVICAREIRYANILGENISEREDLAVKVYVCSTIEKVLELAEEKVIHIFIVDESFVCDKRKRVAAHQTFVLTGFKVADLDEEEWSVAKYQCADEIIREVFELYVERTRDDVMRTVNKNGAKLLAVYSPIHRIGKTSFAMAFGKECAKNKKVLYLNLEEYGGFEGNQDERLNLGDLLYYIRQGNGNLGIRLQSAVTTVDNLDVVLPIPVVLDLKEVTAGEWKELLEQIVKESIYEMIILDVGESVQGLFELLEMCHRVYMPILEDDISCKKVQRFQENIEKLKLEKLKRITYRFVMPRNIENLVKIRAKEEA